MTVPVPKKMPERAELTQQNIVCEAAYAAPSVAQESVQQSVIANTVIQFEFNVKHEEAAACARSVAAPKRQA